MLTIILLAAAYILGSISTAVLVSRALGMPDPRRHGSQNPGATNVLRLGGKHAAALTLAGDVVKGAIPVIFAKFIGCTPSTIALAGLAALLGHIFPIFLGFRGGKGVATALGALLGIHWPIGVAAFAAWLICAWTFRYSSLAAIVATMLTPLFTWWFEQPASVVVIVTVMSALVTWRHRSNMRRLLAGQEDKIGSSPERSDTPP